MRDAGHPDYALERHVLGLVTFIAGCLLGAAGASVLWLMVVLS